jgi:hypothetical protein
VSQFHGMAKMFAVIGFEVRRVRNAETPEDRERIRKRTSDALAERGIGRPEAERFADEMNEAVTGLADAIIATGIAADRVLMLADKIAGALVDAKE